MPNQVITAQPPAGFAGQLLHPDDPGYDEARRIYNGMIDRRPALIARCRSAADVAAALAIARDNALEVTIRGGGHGVSGKAVADGALMIDCSPMKDIHVDPAARTARVGGGVTWGELDAATQEHGLVVTGGRVSNTGVAGLTVGSGSGWLERAFGLTIDNMLACTVVTADGRAVRAAADEHPDLFYALRGGGSNFGVVTEFEFRLQPLGPVVAGGMVVYPYEAAERVLRAYRDFMATAPDEIGGAVALVGAPPPLVPPEMAGAPIVGVLALHTGGVQEGLEALAPLRELAAPLADVIGPMPYVAVQRMIDDGNPWGSRVYFKAAFMEGLDDRAIHDFVQLGADRPSPLTALLLQPLGGAFARVPDDETALGFRRQARWIWHCLSTWLDPADDEANVAFSRLVGVAMEPHSMVAAHPNYIDDPRSVRSLYTETAWEKLVAAKRVWDPDNVFHFNHNIPPAG